MFQVILLTFQLDDENYSADCKVDGYACNEGIEYGLFLISSIFKILLLSIHVVIRFRIYRMDCIFFRFVKIHIKVIFVDPWVVIETSRVLAR
jgi:hypothetical protein